MNVVWITRNLDLPEAHLALGLKARGVNLEVICPHDCRNAAVVRNAGISVAHVRYRGRVDPLGILRLRAHVRERGCQLVHSFTNRALSNILLATVGLNVRNVAYRGTVGHVSRADPLAWLTWLSPRLDCIVCVSDAVRDFLSEVGIPDSKLVRIYKGHDTAWYHSLVEPARSEFRIPPEVFLVACVANMRPVKGVDVLLEAMQLLPEECHLLLIGELRDDRIAALIGTVAHRIHYLGFRNDATHLVQMADCFVMPSREREGLPKAVIEAMAQNVTPVVTRVGGMPELVLHNECGKVVDAGSPQALAAAIRELYLDRTTTRQFGARARNRVEEVFTIRNTVEETFQLYSRLLKSS